MSALMACKEGLNNTGLIDNKRADLYTAVHNRMKELYRGSLVYPRADIKQAVMCFLYGSKAEPNKIFNKDPIIIDTFYKALAVECNGALELQKVLTDNWNPNAEEHTWFTPDGWEAVIPTIVEKEFTYTLEQEDDEPIVIPYKLKVRGTKKQSVANCANVIHSLDSFFVREMSRRCMFDKEQVQEALWYLLQVPVNYVNASPTQELEKLGKFGELVHIYEQTKLCTVRIVDYITHSYQPYHMSSEHRTKLIEILKLMLKQGYVEVVATHDCYHTHSNQLNFIRYWYKEMMADLVESSTLQFVFNQLTPFYSMNGDVVSRQYRKNLAKMVRNSNYGLA